MAVNGWVKLKRENVEQEDDVRRTESKSDEDLMNSKAKKSE